MSTFRGFLMFHFPARTFQEPGNTAILLRGVETKTNHVPEHVMYLSPVSRWFSSDILMKLQDSHNKNRFISFLHYTPRVQPVRCGDSDQLSQCRRTHLPPIVLSKWTCRIKRLGPAPAHIPCKKPKWPTTRRK